MSFKKYPSISRSTGFLFQEFNAHVFDKRDGSNFRVEGHRKKKSKSFIWDKFGVRQHTVEEKTELFGEGVTVFRRDWESLLSDIAIAHEWEQLTVFFEFEGPSSFAGMHVLEEPKTLTLFDAAPYKKGILGPVDFRKIFGHLNVATYLGQYEWTREFVDQVRRGELEGVTLEGVVGKAGSGHKLIMSKAKTQKWIDLVLVKFGEKKGRELVES